MPHISNKKQALLAIFQIKNFLTELNSGEDHEENEFLISNEGSTEDSDESDIESLTQFEQILRSSRYIDKRTKINRAPSRL
jgi:hypothetical protein